MNILYLLPSANLFGGTPVKTLQILENSLGNYYVYFWKQEYLEFDKVFDKTGAKIAKGYYGKNYIKHLFKIVQLIDENEINIIQTQFSFGELLAGFIKIVRPKVKIVITFESSLSPGILKSCVLNFFYRRVDAFVYISEYVKIEKNKQFSILNHSIGYVIYNGSNVKCDTGTEIVKFNNFALLDIAGLIGIKNIKILIEAIDICVNIMKRENLFLYIVGNGPQKQELEKLIIKLTLQRHIFLLGYQTNIGKLINQCDAFVHPCYEEGFGLVISEAMQAQKPIIVANAGALPELIENEKTGLVIDPHDPNKWADAIVRLMDNPELSSFLASNAKKRVQEAFSVERYVKDHETLYNSLIH